MYIETPSAKLNEIDEQIIQATVGVVLFYGRAINNKLVVALNTIITQ